MLKQIKLAITVLIFSSLVFVAGVIQNNKTAHLLSRGNYFFDNTRESNDVVKIKLQFSDGETISLLQKNGLWHVLEADDYFASFARIDSLIKLLRDTTIYRIDTIENAKRNELMTNSTRVEIYNNKDMLIDSVLIAPKKENNVYHYAMRDNDLFLYQISGNYNISSLAMDWVQPLAPIDTTQIRSIKTDNFSIYRKHDLDEFKYTHSHKPAFHAQRFIQYIKSLPVEDIKHSVNFNHKTILKVKSFEITLLNGLIYRLSLYSDGLQYWITIKLNQENLISSDVVSFLEEKSLLFDGWFFKINKDVGELLNLFVL